MELASRGRAKEEGPAAQSLPCDHRKEPAEFFQADMADIVSKRAHYSPPWADVSIIGVAGSSGSGKSTLSHAIVKKLNLPWVVILSMDSFYKTLDENSEKLAFQNEYDFDSPDAIDFDVLVDRLRDLKAGFVYPSSSTPPLPTHRNYPEIRII